jgi:hypothetical protein
VGRPPRCGAQASRALVVAAHGQGQAQARRPARRTDPGAIAGELAAVCNELAEVRETKGGKKTYHTMVAAYFNDMAEVLQSARRVMASGGTMCFVIGDSAPYGVYVPADVWFARLADSAGFTGSRFEKIRDRNTKWKNRKHTVPLNEGRLWISC